MSTLSTLKEIILHVGIQHEKLYQALNSIQKRRGLDLGTLTFTTNKQRYGSVLFDPDPRIRFVE